MCWTGCARSDSWNQRVVRDREVVARREEEARARAEEREREERVEEITERWKAATRAQVSMNRGFAVVAVCGW
jgi:hypothetical protein